MGSELLRGTRIEAAEFRPWKCRLMGKVSKEDALWESLERRSVWRFEFFGRRA